MTPAIFTLTVAIIMTPNAEVRQREYPWKNTVEFTGTHSECINEGLSIARQYAQNHDIRHRVHQSWNLRSVDIDCEVVRYPYSVMKAMGER